MKEELKNKWTDMVSDEELSITAEWLYKLLNPTDKKEFFNVVSVIVERHMPKEDENGYTISNGNQTWTTTYRTQFKMTAVEYLIEFEKDHENLVQPGTIPSNPINYPGSPISIPYYPPITTDPYPWQSPVIYCTNVPGTNQFYCTTTTAH